MGASCLGQAWEKAKAAQCSRKEWHAWGGGRVMGTRKQGFWMEGEGWGSAASYLNPFTLHQFLESSHGPAQGVQDELGQRSHKPGAVHAFSPMHQDAGPFPVGQGLLTVASPPQPRVPWPGIKWARF